MSQRAGLWRRSRTPGPPVRSIRPFKSSEQYLEAMTEDLAEWLRDLYGLDVDAANFLQVLETGLVLCRHANTVTKAALAFLTEAPARPLKTPVPRVGVSCNGTAQPGTFQARDNVSNFIQWCRQEMGIQEVLMFETEDLVLRKNVKNVVLCLLELGRRAWRFGVPAPTLVHLEEEIDQELRQELALPPPDPPPPKPPARQPCHFRNLDQMVQSLVSHCTCPVQFSMVKISEGKYQVGDSNTLIFIRILRSHVMVRVGGGWDTLGHYLDKHDPCRCTSLSHKPGSFLKSPGRPVQHEVKVQDGPSQPQPTMTISRSQSPPPPVDWKTYTSGRNLRPPTPSSSRPCGEQETGPRALGEMAPFLRFREKSLATSQRRPSAGNRSPSPQFSSPHRGRDPQGTPSGNRENRFPGGLSRGRIPTPWVCEKMNSQGAHAKLPGPQKLPAPETTTKAPSARRPSPPPRSSSLIKSHGIWPLCPSTSPQLSERTSVRSPSPSKGLTKIPIRLSSARPPTPRGSFLGTTSESPKERGPLPSRADAENLAGSTHGNCSMEGRHRNQQPDFQVTAEFGDPWGLGTQEKEGRYTPVPLDRIKEQVLSHSLEEEIVANLKLLEVGAACPQGRGSHVIPRSGVYVPCLGGRWPEPGGPYDRVIKELAQCLPPLLKVDLGAWKADPAGSFKLAIAAGPGSPKGNLGVREKERSTKINLSAEDSGLRTVSTPEQDRSVLTVPALPEAPTAHTPDSSSDKVKVCLVKRTLRKPQKVPSIYKLKLRPRIRPRRDHRPEKRPSRIPKPLASLCLGPVKAPPRSKLLSSVLGTKGEARQVDGAGEMKKEKKQESAIPLENNPQPLGSPQHPDEAPLPPEEESWV